MVNRRHLATLLLAVVMLAGTPRLAPAAEAKLTIFAAASLRTALDEISSAWSAETGKQIAISYAATSALAKQIEEGAPADIFMSADRDWMKKLEDGGLVKSGSVTDLLGNDLVLIAPATSSASVTISKGMDLAALVGNGKLAMADVKAVPAGKYGKASLEWLGAWQAVASKVAMAENVRAALKFVALGEAQFGIVYGSDARAEPAVKVLATFPAESHPPIIYPVAIVASSANADAVPFIAYLQGHKARTIFEAQGFTLLTPPATN